MRSEEAEQQSQSEPHCCLSGGLGAAAICILVRPRRAAGVYAVQVFCGRLRQLLELSSLSAPPAAPRAATVHGRSARQPRPRRDPRTDVPRISCGLAATRPRTVHAADGAAATRPRTTRAAQARARRRARHLPRGGRRREAALARAPRAARRAPQALAPGAAPGAQREPVRRPGGYLVCRSWPSRGRRLQLQKSAETVFVQLQKSAKTVFVSARSPQVPQRPRALARGARIYETRRAADRGPRRRPRGQGPEARRGVDARRACDGDGGREKVTNNPL